MMNKNTTARIYGLVLGTMFAIVVTFVVYHLWRTIPIPLILLMFIGLWAGFFITGLWIFNRNFPISGAERRRRNKQFYDWLRSQGRR
jgi:cell division protein FtsW (lipid II flippase)